MVRGFLHQDEATANGNIDQEPKHVLPLLAGFPSNAVCGTELICPVHAIHVLCVLFHSLWTWDIKVIKSYYIPKCLGMSEV
jgi:hypothetical protein